MIPMQKCCVSIFLSTLSLRRATDDMIFEEQTQQISIHALLAESDPSFCALPSKAGISIHALLAESDAPNRRPYHCNRNFYPRSPCGERLRLFFIIFNLFRFLSTLSLRRATASQGAIAGYQMNFYPRSPCGERHLATWKPDYICRISIHALLAESDAGPGP